jgi:hypothetical protein
VIDYHCALIRFVLVDIPMVLLSATRIFLIVMRMFSLSVMHIFFLAATDKR